MRGVQGSHRDRRRSMRRRSRSGRAAPGSVAGSGPCYIQQTEWGDRFPRPPVSLDYVKNETRSLSVQLLRVFFTSNVMLSGSNHIGITPLLAGPSPWPGWPILPGGAGWLGPSAFASKSVRLMRRSVGRRRPLLRPRLRRAASCEGMPSPSRQTKRLGKSPACRFSKLRSMMRYKTHGRRAAQ